MRGVPAHPRTALLLGSAGSFLITLDILIVNLALPRMGAELGATTGELQWIVDGYTLLFAALLLSAGNAADRFGAKQTFAVGIVLFGITSVLCTLAPTAVVLIVARCAQGVGAALMLPASMSLIRESFPDPAARARALGVWAAGGAVSTAVGPILGGLLTTWDWRLVFAINIPVCVGMLLALPRVARSTPRAVPFDAAGQALGLIGLGGVLFGVIESGARGLGDVVVLSSLVIGCAAIGGFIAVQRRVAHPMMPLDLLAPRPMRIAILASFAFIFSWYGTVFLTTLYLQQRLGMPPLLAGLVFVPSALLAIVGNLISGPLANRYAARAPVAVGLGSMTVGLVCGAVMISVGSAWLAVVVLMLVGAGGSIAMPPLAGVVLGTADEDRAGIASAALNTFRQVGGALAIAVFGAVIAGSAGFAAGTQISFTIAAALALLATTASLGLERSRRSDSLPTR
ncbi:MFS transporter [Microbacterium laevaniformans]|uniref:MFS transporter n=1 Tax=Microbacterium laevaniformans TaxID=36807 RepID=A0A4S2CVE6_9MICO|nr:MFS transporter [Microbacterium laevaniformans]TGY32928.1 MFS transporter [Microbacterium laevaniformans]